ncbi:toll/interleukin-1 receptor domain-containing protein [Pectobacterium polaris]|uniref:Toll/interleukin-1 receptor domain-containing protein n=1 Tax=Pectobacterium polaris TaxID=2042057 RepID=A0AAW4NZF6_9GAMM|nr:toll/interleukin-1 receptor domain-containing protein [Pectobacterium polaris]MBW5892559.1 toll/interleukin-1 receptor domain-containing protein [Pectobacterium polaris]
MSLRPGDYGIVKVIHGEHKGRIGYYDDDDFISAEEEIFDDDEHIYEESENEDQIAIVYFGDFLLAPEYYSISHDALEHVSMNDLMARKEELFSLCSPFLMKKKTNYTTLCSYFSELHLVETTILEKIVEQRYVNKPTGLKVFISHSSKDKPFAKLLCMDLEANGHIPWLDEWDISVGESIPEKISIGLQNADFIIVILSKNSVSSKWVEREWQIKYWNEIEKGRINVLPILLQDCQIPELLRTKKYADFRTDFNRGLNDLLSALENLSRKL